VSLRRPRLALALAAGLAVAAPARGGPPYVWIDENGLTHATDDPKQVPPEARRKLVPEAGLGELWADGATGPPLETPPGASGSDEDRVVRLLRDAAEELQRGDTARASATLEGVLRLDPGRAEAHWYLAGLDRDRGRFTSAESHLRAFLAAAGPELDPWRARAVRRLAALADERRLADAQAAGPLRLVALAGPHFRIRYDAALGEASPDYAQTVVRDLEDARREVASFLGVTPKESTGVVLYSRAAYARANADRFSFRTVGFFDGQIHVASAAHPAQELRALLFHEYVHAVFYDATGGDRPFWLNEGLAELAARTALGSARRVPSEREALRRRIEDGSWVSLRSLADGFSGLDDARAEAAYQVSTAAADWLVARTDAAARARLLRQIGAGATADEALRAVVGKDTDSLDAAVRREIRAEFPEAAASGAARRAPGD
jgi:hypothetical protein